MALTALVVEDSPTMRQLIVYALSRIRGLTVIEADDGVDALKKLAGGHYDIIITDINMPVMDGLKLVKRGRAGEGLQATPVVIITSGGADARGDHAAAAERRAQEERSAAAAHPGEAGGVRVALLPAEEGKGRGGERGRRARRRGTRRRARRRGTRRRAQRRGTGRRAQR